MAFCLAVTGSVRRYAIEEYRYTTPILPSLLGGCRRKGAVTFFNYGDNLLKAGIWERLIATMHGYARLACQLALVSMQPGERQPAGSSAPARDSLDALMVGSGSGQNLYSTPTHMEHTKRCFFFFG